MLAHESFIWAVQLLEDTRSSNQKRFFVFVGQICCECLYWCCVVVSDLKLYWPWFLTNYRQLSVFEIRIEIDCIRQNKQAHSLFCLQTNHIFEKSHFDTHKNAHSHTDVLSLSPPSLSLTLCCFYIGICAPNACISSKIRLISFRVQCKFFSTKNETTNAHISRSIYRQCDLWGWAIENRARGHTNVSGFCAEETQHFHTAQQINYSVCKSEHFDFDAFMMLLLHANYNDCFRILCLYPTAYKPHDVNGKRLYHNIYRKVSVSSSTLCDLLEKFWQLNNNLSNMFMLL